MKVGYLLKVCPFLLLLSGCTDEEAVRGPLRVRTTGISFQGDSIIFSAELENADLSLIDSYGFYIRTDTARSTYRARFVAYTKPLAYKNFEGKVFSDFLDDTTYYVRAAILTKGSDDLIYGNALSFDGQAKAVMTIEDFQPRTGVRGGLVKIYGSNFSNNVQKIQVYFGHFPARIVSASPDRLVVEVPQYDVASHVPIRIKKFQQEVFTSEPFFLAGPEIESFSPARGTGKTIITVQGSGFSPYPWRNIVKVGGYAATVLTSDPTQLTIELDAINIRPGQYDISVEVDEMTAVSASPFEVYNNWNEVAVREGNGIVHPASFSINNVIYLVGGSSLWLNQSGYHDEVWALDLERGQWQRKPDFPGGIRVNGIGFSIGTRGYVVGGTNKSGGLSDFWEYNASLDTWTQRPAFPGGVRRASIGFSHDGKGYILFGADEWGLTNEFWSYDPAGNEWTRLPDFAGHTRQDAHVVIHKGKLYVVGGQDISRPFAMDIWRYDFSTQEWEFVDYIDKNILYPIAAFYTPDKACVLNYRRDSFGKEQMLLFEYDPETNILIKALGPVPSDYLVSIGFYRTIGSSLVLGLGYLRNSEFNYGTWQYTFDE